MRSPSPGHACCRELTVPERYGRHSIYIYYISVIAKNIYRESELVGVLSGVERRRVSREERDYLTLSERSKKNSGERKKK